MEYTVSCYQQHRPLTTGQIARFCHVTHRAVLKWVVSGKLKAYRTPGHHSRINTKDFIGFLKTYHMPIPEGFTSNNGHKKKILIVDDDRGIVHSLQRTLMLENKYDIEVAFDGFNAGRRFYAFRPDFVILDILMPGVDGYEVCAQIRRDKANKHVKILAISGVSEEKEIKKIMDLGANDYLAKPFTNKMLQDKMKKFLGEDDEQS